MIGIETIQEELYDKYYGQFHKILLDGSDEHFRIEVDLYELAQYNPFLIAQLRKHPSTYIALFDDGKVI
jgi:DNA replicative helicase MCM subunit Mcm2 (Cdc46/Mcm family)